MQFHPPENLPEWFKVANDRARLNTKELASLLGCTRAQIFSNKDAGTLPPYIRGDNRERAVTLSSKRERVCRLNGGQIYWEVGAVRQWIRDARR